MSFSSVDLGVFHERCQDSIIEGEAETVQGLVQSHPASQDSRPGILHYSVLLFVVGL